MARAPSTRKRASKRATLRQRLDLWSEPYVDADTCQLWRASTTGGYGRFKWKGRMILAHRAAWECEFGPVPDGLCVLHHCDNPPCRNLDHLFLGTNADNVADKVAKGRQQRLRGEASALAKLSHAQAIELLTISRSVPNWAVGAMYGVCEMTISHIRNGRRWPHLAR